MAEVQAPESLGRPVERPPRTRRSGGTMIAGKFIRRDEVAALVQNGDMIGLIGGGGVVEATLRHHEMEKRFLGEVARIGAARGDQRRSHQTIEHGTYGGTFLTGSLFGSARNPACMIEIAPGIDVEAGVLNRMAFRPVINALNRIKSLAHFTEHKQ